MVRGIKSKLKISTLREIRSTLGRFMAILAIVSLGVGFFSGVRVTTPAMVHTVSEFMNEQEFCDYRLISTVGWGEEDIESLSEEEDVRSAEGANSADVLFVDEDNNELVYKVHSLTKNVNKLKVVSGRLARKESECVADAQSGIKVGDTLTVAAKGNDSDTIDTLKFKELIVVGTAYSPYYVNFERGTTSLGTGSVDGFLYVVPEAFDLDYFTEIFVRFDRDDELFAKSYDDFMDTKQDLWEAITREQADARYERLLTDAQTELDEGKEELEKNREDGQKQLDEAKKTLDDTEEQLTDAKKELDDAQDEIIKNEKKLKDAKKELDDGEEQLDDAKAQLDSAKKTLDQGENQLTDAQAQLDGARTQIDVGKEQLDAAEKVLSVSEKQLSDAKAQIGDGESQLTSAEQQIADAELELQNGEAQIAENEEELKKTESQVTEAENRLNEMLDEFYTQAAASVETVEGLIPQRIKDQINSQTAAPEEILSAIGEYITPQQQIELTFIKEQISSGKSQLETAKSQLESGRQEIEKNKKLLEEKRAELETGKAEYEAGLALYNEGLAAYQQSLQDYNAGLSQYSSGMSEYYTGKAEYDKGLKQYTDGKAEYEANLALFKESQKQYEEGKAQLEEGKKQYEDGKKQYEDGLEQFEDGKKEYEDGVREFDEKIADAENQIADAEEQIKDLEEPETYVLDRSTNIGAACFENDSQIVEQVAKVFPIFFILVAALVCMTTMSRMVEEQRSQIGTLKALGYSESAIMGKYLFYSGSAAFIGCTLGYFVGIVLFPGVIWATYKLMYIPLPMDFIFDGRLAVVSVVVSLLCSMGTTWLSCRYELNETAAELMRPKAPKAGKRVLLEYVPFIWNHLKFLHKVSIRNIFRYKKRLFMMIVGISGCTALLLTGFGIRDSIAGFADVQYDEILVADAEMQFTAKDGTIPEKLENTLADYTKDHKLIKQSSWDIITEDNTKSITLIIPEDYGNMKKYFNFIDENEEPVAPPAENEIIVCTAIHERYGVNVGDEITLRDDKMREMQVTVSGVFDNHVYNYVFMDKDTYSKQLGESPEWSGAYLNFNEGEDEYVTAAEIAKDSSVVSVGVYDEVSQRMRKSMASLDYIVLLVILCAAGLAFIVLYNLTNINITERIREIATIKVLGFFKKETSAYVLRENIALTAAGIAVGLGLGVLLHGFVMSRIIVDMVSFKVRILPMSYVYSVLLTFLFNFIVDLVMEAKLEKINMAESLKSVE